MKPRNQKIAKWMLIAGLALGSLDYGLRLVAHNVMSHCGFREYSVLDKLKMPSTYLTRGHYQGFRNSGLDTDFGETDSLVYDPDPFDRLGNGKGDTDINAIYLGRQKNSFPLSPYQPTHLTDAENQTYYSIKEFIENPERLVGEEIISDPEDLERILHLKEGEVISDREVSVVHRGNFTNVDLGNYTLSFSRDKKGIYTSIYDVWDFSPNAGFFKEHDLPVINLAARVLSVIGTPIHFYDRFYWDDYTSKK